MPSQELDSVDAMAQDSQQSKALRNTPLHGSRAGLNPRLPCWRAMASSLLDLRSLSKPQRFDGQEQKWRDWRFSFEAYCGLLADGFQTTTQQSSEHPTPVSMAALPATKHMEAACEVL